VRLQPYEHFADRDPLTKAVLERMLAGLSSRRHRRTQEPVGSQVEPAEPSTSRLAVSRTFVECTRQSLDELISRRLDDVRLAAMMIDGLELQGRTNVVALGIATEGVKIPAGSGRARPRTRPSQRLLLSDRVERDLDPGRGSCS
jgi:putative transposase